MVDNRDENVIEDILGEDFQSGSSEPLTEADRHSHPCKGTETIIRRNPLRTRRKPARLQDFETEEITEDRVQDRKSVV